MEEEVYMPGNKRPHHVTLTSGEVLELKRLLEKKVALNIISKKLDCCYNKIWYNMRALGLKSHRKDFNEQMVSLSVTVRRKNYNAALKAINQIIKPFKL